MDPTQCAKVNGSDYCWVQASGGEKGKETEPLGAYLFPVIQHYEQDCMNCSFNTNGVPDGKPLTCNEVNLEFLLFFNPLRVSVPHYVATQNTSLYPDYKPNERRKTSDPEGSQGNPKSPRRK